MLVAKSDSIEFTVQDDYDLRFSNYRWIWGEGKQECGVPANATLQNTLKLVSWKIVSNVTSDKMVVKRILKEGEGYEGPKEGDVVLLFKWTVKLIGKRQDWRHICQKKALKKPTCSSSKQRYKNIYLHEVAGNDTVNVCGRQ
ncbi:hypothetical protein LXL04_007397 [Taraxacum kok-saghyz]